MSADFWTGLVIGIVLPLAGGTLILVILHRFSQLPKTMPKDIDEEIDRNLAAIRQRTRTQWSNVPKDCKVPTRGFHDLPQGGSSTAEPDNRIPPTGGASTAPPKGRRIG